MFAHPHVCPWVRRPLTLPLACTLGAAIGTSVLAWSGVGPLSVVFVMAASIAILRAMKLHMPPVLGIGLLPQVMPHTDWHFVLAVALGSSGLTGFFLITQSLQRSTMFDSRGEDEAKTAAQVHDTAVHLVKEK